MQSDLSTPTQRKRPATVQIARWSSRHRWLVFGLWFVFTIGLFGVSLAIGTKTNSSTNAPGATVTEAQKAYDVWSAANPKVAADPNALASEDLIVVVRHPSLKTTDADYKAAITKMTEDLQAAKTAEGQNLFSRVVNPYLVPPTVGLIAPDNTAVRIVVTTQAKPDNKAIKAQLDNAQQAIDKVKEANNAYQIYVYNGRLLDSQVDELVSHELDGSLKITIPITFAVLLIAFGTVAAAVVPLILAVTALLAAFGLFAIYSHIVAPVDSYASQLIVLIGLAVAIDYSLFMITRYRTERRHGRSKLQAIEIASSTAGRAVFFSGVVVMISLAGLYLIGDTTFSSMATGTIGVVLISVIGSLTFLPATLSILGNGVNWGRIPYFGREREEGSGFWSHLVSAVMRRPLTLATIVVAVLLALSLPVLHLKLGNNAIDGLPTSIEGVKALRVMNEHWPQGTTLRMYVMVTGADKPETKPALDGLNKAILENKTLSDGTLTMSKDGKVAQLAYYMGGSRNDQINHDLVLKVRNELIPQYLGKVPDAKAYVTGAAAVTLDSVKLYTDAIPLVFGFVLGLSFLLLLVAFRSLIIPIKAILLNLLSTGTSYGVLVLVFQDGWFSQQLGFTPTGVIEGFVPLFLFTILFGLSMDYHLFILTRIKESKDHGMDSNHAVAKGISVTSGVITSAAAIMVAVFAVFVTLQIMIIRQLGLGLAVAVFVDATIIRCVLLPATMRLLGDWNWWLPKFLNWLPHVTIEGTAEEYDELPQASEKDESLVASS